MGDWVEKIDRKLAIGSLVFSVVMLLVDGPRPFYVGVILIDIITLINKKT